VLGYAVAVAVMVVVVGLLISSLTAADRILRSTGRAFIVFRPAEGPDARTGGKKSPREGFVAAEASSLAVPAPVLQQVRKINGVVDACELILYQLNERHGDRPVVVAGVDPASKAPVSMTCCGPPDLISGRFLKPGDRGVVMLHGEYALASGLCPVRSPRPDKPEQIGIAGRTLEVIGVVHPPPRPVEADIYLHIEEARELIGSRAGTGAAGGKANIIAVKVENPKAQDAAKKAVTGLGLGLRTLNLPCMKPRKVMEINREALWLLTVVVALFTLVLAARTQLSSVIERRRDIAILKAVGWSDGAVVRLLLTESAIQAVLGAVAGCVLAAATVVLAPSETLRSVGAALPPNLWPWILVAATALALAGGILAAGVPALSAARLRPADALRRP